MGNEAQPQDTRAKVSEVRRALADSTEERHHDFEALHKLQKGLLNVVQWLVCPLLLAGLIAICSLGWSTVRKVDRMTMAMEGQKEINDKVLKMWIFGGWEPGPNPLAREKMKP